MSYLLHKRLVIDQPQLETEAEYFDRKGTYSFHRANFNSLNVGAQFFFLSVVSFFEKPLFCS